MKRRTDYVLRKMRRAAAGGREILRKMLNALREHHPRARRGGARPAAGCPNAELCSAGCSSQTPGRAYRYNCDPGGIAYRRGNYGIFPAEPELRAKDGDDFGRGI